MQGMEIAPSESWGNGHIIRQDLFPKMAQGWFAGSLSTSLNSHQCLCNRSKNRCLPCRWNYLTSSPDCQTSKQMGPRSAIGWNSGAAVAPFLPASLLWSLESPGRSCSWTTIMEFRSGKTHPPSTLAPCILRVEVFHRWGKTKFRVNWTQRVLG